MTDAVLTAPMPALPAPSKPFPMERSPAAVCPASLADGPGRASMRSTLRQIAAMLGYGLESCPWHELRAASALPPPRTPAMSATTFDTLKAARDLEAAGVERRQAEAIAKAMRDAAGADRGEFVTRGELYRALWIQGAGIVAILTARRFLPI